MGLRQPRRPQVARYNKDSVLVSITPKLDRPKWLRAPAPAGENYRHLKDLIERLRLHTVCESAACPTWASAGTSGPPPSMILGNVCTRRCGFCAVEKGAPLPVDYDEPRRGAEAVAAGRGSALRTRPVPVIRPGLPDPAPECNRQGGPPPTRLPGSDGRFCAWPAG